MTTPDPTATPAQVLERESALDNLMVDDFARQMKAKLAAARMKGRGGWHDPEVCTLTDLYQMMIEHVNKPNLDMVDVANFAGMLWWRLQRGTAEEAAPLRAQAEALAEQAAAVERLRTMNREMIAFWRNLGNPMLAAAARDLEDKLTALTPTQEAQS